MWWRVGDEVNTKSCYQTITSWSGWNDFHREETTKLTPRALALRRELILETSVLYPFHGGYLILIYLFDYKVLVFHFPTDFAQHFPWKRNLFAQCRTIIQARNQGGCTGCARTPPQAPKVHILILNIQVKECSRLNWSLKLNNGV